MPAALLDEGDKAFLHRPDPEQAAATVAAYAGHYLSWPGAQIAYLMQKDGGGHESQVDFDILGNAASGAVYASKPGVVVFAKQSSAGGCPSMACWQQANMVVVRHDTGEYSWYVHLAPGSVPVRVGDRVGYGTKIGVEGETGFARGVHLHYMVSTGHTTWTPPEDPNSAPWALDIRRVDFHEAAWDQLTVGQRYTSQNGMGGPCPGPLPEANQVALYEHAGYCGLYTLLNAGPYANPAALAFPNDAASSIRVGRDAAAALPRRQLRGRMRDVHGRRRRPDRLRSGQRPGVIRVLPRGQVAPPAAPVAPARRRRVDHRHVRSAGVERTGERRGLCVADRVCAGLRRRCDDGHGRRGRIHRYVTRRGVLLAGARAQRRRAVGSERAGLLREGRRALLQPAPRSACLQRCATRPKFASPGWIPRRTPPTGCRCSPATRRARAGRPISARRSSWTCRPASAATRPPLGGWLVRGARVPLAGGQAHAIVQRVAPPRHRHNAAAAARPRLRRRRDPDRAHARLRLAIRSRRGRVSPSSVCREGLQAGSIAAPQTLAPFIDIRTGETAYTGSAARRRLRLARAPATAGTLSAWSEPRTVRMVAPTSWETYLPALSGG